MADESDRQAGHSVEGMTVRCYDHGVFFGTVHDGHCSECGRKVRIVEDEVKR